MEILTKSIVEKWSFKELTNIMKVINKYKKII